MTSVIEWKPLLWYLLVWDMSFLLWGLLFAAAAWRFGSLRPLASSE